MHVRSHIQAMQGHLLEAEQVAKTMLELGEQIDNLELKVWAVYRLSGLASKKQMFDEALSWLDQAEIWCKELKWLRGLAWMMYRRGATLILQKNSMNAEQFLLQSLNMATSWNERRLIAYNKHLLIQVYMNTNRLQEAIQMAEESRDLYERLGMIRDLGEVDDELLPELSNNSGE